MVQLYIIHPLNHVYKNLRTLPDLHTYIHIYIHTLHTYPVAAYGNSGVPIGASLVTLSLNDELIESCIKGYQVRLGQVKHGRYY